MSRMWCRFFGHRWVGVDLEYEQGYTLASVGGVMKTVGVTWVNDECCSRCGRKAWWPA